MERDPYFLRSSVKYSTKKALFDFMRKNRDLLILLAGVDQLPNYSRSSKQELIDFCAMKAKVCHVDNVHMLEEM